MLIAIAAAALAISATCDLEKPTGAPGCQRIAVDALRLNQIQAVGTHNSYKQAIAPAEMALLRAAAPQVADSLDYAKPPLGAQLDAGARQLEIDVLYDPRGGLYADPVARRLAPGTTPDDLSPLKGPGLKVMHVQGLDYRSSCPLFTDCLKAIRAWSRSHRQHVPLLILVNLKSGGVEGLPGAVTAPEFDEAAFAAIDAEIRSVFRPREMIAPDAVQGRHASLREGVLAGGWPTLGQARGKVLFALDAGPEAVAVYRGARRALEGRAMFVNTDEASPAAAYLTLNEPLEQAARIAAAVRAGFLVRTRADADTVEARRNDTARRDAALASGAQYVSTDYLAADPRFSDYRVALPDGMIARVDPQVEAVGAR